MAVGRADKPFTPDIVILYCRAAMAPGTAPPPRHTEEAFARIRTVMLPCGNKVEVPHLLRILEQGADGIEVVACPEKACRSLLGSARAARRIAYANGLLLDAGLGATRLGISHAAGLTGEQLIALAAARAAAVLECGPNPIKQGERQ